MLATALARGAAEAGAGARLYLTTAADLAARCHKAALKGRCNTCIRFFAGTRLLIIDELGRLSPVPGDQPALPEVLDDPDHQRRADWANRFGDATVAATMLDRLLHGAAVVGIDGPSYRLRTHQRAADTCALPPARTD